MENTKKNFGIELVQYTPQELLRRLVELMERDDLSLDQVKLVEEANRHMLNKDFKKASLSLSVIYYADAKENKGTMQLINNSTKSINKYAKKHQQVAVYIHCSDCFNLWKVHVEDKLWKKYEATGDVDVFNNLTYTEKVCIKDNICPLCADHRSKLK